MYRVSLIRDRDDKPYYTNMCDVDNYNAGSVGW